MSKKSKRAPRKVLIVMANHNITSWVPSCTLFDYRGLEWPLLSQKKDDNDHNHEESGVGDLLEIA